MNDIGLITTRCLQGKFPVTYTNWQPNEPNDGLVNVQDFGMMWAGPTGAHGSGWVPGKWDDFTSPEKLLSSYRLGIGGIRTVHGLVEGLATVVDIDIKLGSGPKCGNSIPVAVLGSDSFDVTQIDPNTLSFEGLNILQKGNGALSCRYEEANHDGYLDLVCHYANGLTEGTLSGELLDGTFIESADVFCIKN